MAHVLVVDDDTDIRQAMRSLLEEVGGHTVLEAEDGLRALECLRASENRLVVLLDQRMPRLDGIGVLNIVMADEQLATRHAYILLSASGRIRMALPSSTNGIPVPVLSKPFDIGDLLDAVQTAAQQK